MHTASALFVHRHDLGLLAMALGVCVLAALVAVRLHVRARASTGDAQLGWLFLTGIAAGGGIWATHFVATVAYDPGVPVAFDAGRAAISLLSAVASTALGFYAAAKGDTTGYRALGGAMVGIGIASMHYAGVSALQVAGRIEWNTPLVTLSIVAGPVFGAAALLAARDGRRTRERRLAAGLLVGAIVIVHIVAIAAMRIVPDAAYAVVPNAIAASQFLAFAVAGVTLVVIGAGFATVVIDARAEANALRHLREFTEGAGEGLVIVDDNRIVDVNQRFLSLMNRPREAVIGAVFHGGLIAGAERADGSASEAFAETGTGARVPVEIASRPLAYAGRPHRLYTVRDLSERRAAENRIRFLAEHDALTGLPNRSAFQEMLADALHHAAANGEQFALFWLDLDRFKDANDVFGHPAGDAILREAALRMTRVAGPTTTCARMGGDEFVLLQRGVETEAAARGLAEAVSDVLRRPFIIDGRVIGLCCSIGITLYPRDGTTAEELQTRADMALYRAKAAGRNTFRFFEGAMDEEIRDRRALAFDLSRAIEARELELHYQPIASMRHGACSGFEALLRWRHPIRGLVPPSVFIPIAEEMGLIVALGEWVLRTACTAAARWSNPLKVAVNLSTVQLREASLPETVHAILVETGLSPRRLDLEVTETALMTDPQRALDVLRRLKALGVSISMDDFGTGYSSLATLQAFPFDKLKLDKSFVDRADTHHQAASIVRAVLGLGRSLEIPVVAEGVERQGQMDFLVGENCAEIQGYIIGAPAPIEDYACLTGGTAETPDFLPVGTEKALVPTPAAQMSLAS